MATEQFANNAQTALASAVDDDPGTASIVVEDADPFPAAVPFRVRIGDELMLVTARSGTGDTTWTVERELEGTDAAAHAAGGMVVQVLTAGLMEDLAALVADQAANTVLAGPAAGGDDTPAYRALVAADLPAGVAGAVVPAGAVVAFARTSAPAGWLACDGAAVSRATYSDLFSAIGTTWGTGNGSTTFNVPDFRRRVAVGSGGSGTGTLGNAVGNTGGAETHTLTAGEMPAHTHGLPNGYNDQAFSTWVGCQMNQSTYDYATPTATAGGDGPHNNLPPSAVVLYCVKA